MLSKIIIYLLKKHKIITYFSILGFITSSLILMLIEIFSSNIPPFQIPYGIFSFILGYFIVNKINTLFANK